MAMLFSTKKAAVKPVETVTRSHQALSQVFSEAEKALPLAAVNDLIIRGQKLVSAPNTIKGVVSEEIAHLQMKELSAKAAISNKGPTSKL
jgi:hypothetical protein